MSTAMSTKRSFLSDRSLAREEAGVAPSTVRLSLYALFAGVLLMIAGGYAGVDVVMIVGFFAAACGGLALNALFWAQHYEMHGQPEISIRSTYLQ